MNLPGPFEIQRVEEFVWEGQPADFVLENVTREDFEATRTARDPRFVNVGEFALRMSFHSLIVRTGHGILLVDSCVGNQKERRLVPSWHMQNFPYLERLRAVGLTPDDIDFVCCTHLHGDHVGWNTRLENGRWVPTFSKARYLLADPEVAYWEDLHQRKPDNMYRQVWEDSVLPVIAAGLVERVDADAEILPGIRLRPAPGHTPGNVVIDLDDGRHRAVMSGDVIHHPVQIERPNWCATFDRDQPQALQSRLALLERIADTGRLLLGAHFTAPSALVVEREADGFWYRDPS